MIKQIKSCGVIVYTMINNTIHYIIIQNKSHGNYGFPKGHSEEGESEKETALREVHEEIGINVSLLDDFKAQISYKLKTSEIKNVVYFLGCTDDTTITIQEEEISDYKILPYKEALEVLSYENDRDILKLANKYLKVNI